MLCERALLPTLSGSRVSVCLYKCMRSERERLTHTNTHTHIHTHAHQVVFNENSTVAGPVKMAGLAAEKIATVCVRVRPCVCSCGHLCAYAPVFSVQYSRVCVDAHMFSVQYSHICVYAPVYSVQYVCART